MKKLFYLLVVLFMFSCSTDDNFTEPQNNLNPPEWIQGTWLLNDSGAIFNIGFTFTTDDVVVYNISFPTSLSGTIDEYTKVNESITDAEYYIIIDYINHMDVSYDFYYLNPTKIRFGTDLILTKQ